MTLDRSWPISVETLRNAIGYKATEGSDDELEFFAQQVCERIDKETGRDTDPTRHLVTITVTVDDETQTQQVVPLDFIMAARILGRLSWQQQKNGPRGLPAAAGDQPATPMGIDLPRTVQGILGNYPPPPGFGQPVETP